MHLLEITMIIFLGLWVFQQEKRREKEQTEKYNYIQKKLVNTQLALKLTLNELQKHYPDIYAKSFFHMRDSLEIEKDWFM